MRATDIIATTIIAVVIMAEHSITPLAPMAIVTTMPAIVIIIGIIIVIMGQLMIIMAEHSMTLLAPIATVIMMPVIVTIIGIVIVIIGQLMMSLHSHSAMWRMPSWCYLPHLCSSHSDVLGGASS